MSLLPMDKIESIAAICITAVTGLGVGVIAGALYRSPTSSCLRSPPGFVNGIGDTVVLDGRLYSCNFLREPEDTIECREMEPCE